MNTLTTLRTAISSIEEAHDESMDNNHVLARGILDGVVADLRTLIAELEAQEPFAWAIHYKDSAENHGVVLDTDRELAIARCEDCMGNSVESYSEPFPLFTHPEQPKAEPVQEPVNSCETCAHFKQGTVYEMECFECSQYYPDKYEARAIERKVRGDTE
jgi:hypothetical protein